MTISHIVTNRQKTSLDGDLTRLIMTFLNCNNESPKCFIRKILTKREQKIADREVELLDVAEAIMAHEGFSGLTMDKLVASCDYSKGTVYNHFSNKEDLFCALCIKSIRIIMSQTKRALAFEGSLREQCLALCYVQRLHSQLHPTLFLCVLLAKTPAVQERASVGRLALQSELEQEMTLLVDALFAKALAEGKIAQVGEDHIENLSFTMWSVCFGANALLIGARDAKAIARLNGDQALLFNLNALLDGIGWQPLSNSWDYQATWQRIATEIFSAEVAALQE